MTETIVLGGGCFWCLEALFERFEGVDRIVPGYSGGQLEFPAYEQVCTGQTGHAEVVKIDFRNDKLSYRNLLEAFLLMHDPTSLNRQGADQGTQYRSVIFAQSAEQEIVARGVLQEASNSGLWSRPIVTEIDGAKPFYPATVDHHSYYQRHAKEPYCSLVIKPKLEALASRFATRLKHQ